MTPTRNYWTDHFLCFSEDDHAARDLRSSANDLQIEMLDWLNDLSHMQDAGKAAEIACRLALVPRIS